MIRAAEIVDGKVTRVIVGNPAWATQNLGGAWVVTENKVGKGWTYNDVDGFRPPQPFPSWVWVEGRWESPVPQPDGAYYWNEPSGNWLPDTSLQGESL